MSSSTGTSVAYGTSPVARADGVPALDDRVGEQPSAALGLREAGVVPGAERSVGQRDRVAATLARSLGAADVALAEHERRPEVVLHHALERAEVVGSDELVAVERLGVLAVVHPGRERLAGLDAVEAQTAISLSPKSRG